MTDAKKSVLITCPNTDYVHRSVVAVLMRLLLDGRYKVNIIMPKHRPYENNLHHIVVDFLKGGYDYWLNIDSDNPPRKNPLDLIEFDKDFIGLPTPVWHFVRDKQKPGEAPIYWNVYRKDPKGSDAYVEWHPRDGFQKVDAVGTGCFIASRRLFLDPKMQKGPFIRKTYPDGRVDKGNDISFCERAREAGWELWAHFDYDCDHFSEMSMLEMIRAFDNLYDAGTHKT